MGQQGRGNTKMIPAEEQQLQRPEGGESWGLSGKGKELCLKQRGKEEFIGLPWELR